MNKMKKVLAGALAILLAASFGACSMFQVNEERDNQSVVATIAGEDVLKKEFKDYYKFLCIIYVTNGYDVPEEGDELKEFKQTVFDEFILNKLIAKECDAVEIAADSQKVEKAADELIAKAKETQGSDEAYEKLLAQYGYTAETFRPAAIAGFQLNETASLYAESDKRDYSSLSAKAAVTVDGVAVPMSIFYYYAISDQLLLYATGSTPPSTEEGLLELFDETLEKVAKAQAYIAYGEANGLTVTKEEIDAEMATINLVESYFGEEQLSYITGNYYLTDADVTAAKEFMGKALAYEAKIGSKALEELDTSDKVLEKYYSDNQKKFDESTVSAYHILVKDKTVAKTLETEAGGTAEGFMATYEKHKDDEGVTEAADLGEFNKSKMVDDFTEAVFAMKEGEVKLVETEEFGYHLVYVYKTNIKEVPAFADIKDEVKETYIADKKAETQSSALEKVYKAAKVKKGDYGVLPQNAYLNALKEKYEVQTKDRNALR